MDNGSRVRINCAYSAFHGREGVVVKHTFTYSQVHYRVLLDGADTPLLFGANVLLLL